MKNILVPTDFSINAWKATAFILKVFENELCVFYFLHANKSYAHNQRSSENNKKVTANNELKLEQLIEKVKSVTKNENHKHKCVVKASQLKNAIEELQKEIIFDLIVMGAKGETEPKNRLLGTNSLNIIEAVNSTPVLIVPKNAVFLTHHKKEMVFATRYEKEFSLYEINFLQDFAATWNASIRILYVQEEEKLTKKQEERKEELHLHLGNLTHSFHTLTNIEVPIGIHSFLKSRKSDLLVLNHHKKGFFRNLFSKDLPEQLKSQSQIPFLFMSSK